MPYQLDPAAALRLGQAVLQQEAEALHMIADRIGDDFVEAVRILLDCRGRLVVSGVGKSGHIGRKLAATFASTGTPAFFVHAAEAAHGDLGMITSDDVVLAISYSGETNELLTIVPTLKREGARLIAMTGNPNSSLAKYADVHLNCHVEREACPLNLAPTTSTTATLALGDALAVSCLSAKGFSRRTSREAIRAARSDGVSFCTSPTSCARATRCPSSPPTRAFSTPSASSPRSTSA